MKSTVTARLSKNGTCGVSNGEITHQFKLTISIKIAPEANANEFDEEIKAVNEIMHNILADPGRAYREGRRSFIYD